MVPNSIFDLVEGQSVGILAATAIGSELTQKTLDTFHAAGTADVVIEGVERIQQCLNNSSTINRVFFKVQVAQKDLRRTVYTTLGDVVVSRPKETSIETIEWLSIWESRYGSVKDALPLVPHVLLSVIIPLEKQFEFDVDISTLKQELLPETKHSPIPVACSPLLSNDLSTDFYNELIIAFVYEFENIEEISHGILSPDVDICSKLLYFVERVWIPKIFNIRLFGIRNVLQIISDDTCESKSIILCNSFASLLDVIHIDPIGIVCNKTLEMYNIYGIEVARKCLLVELTEIMTKILPCHVQVIIDIMTWTGRITSITRYSARKTDVLKRMTFEESVRNVVTACIEGEIDKLSSFSSKIVTSKRF